MEQHRTDTSRPDTDGSGTNGPDARRALVVGAGIGGLTAAVALHRRGWRVTVLERAADLTPVGAGIGLAPNAQRALDVVGLGDRVRALSAWQGDGGMRTPGGRWLVRTDAAAAAARFGGPSSSSTAPPSWRSSPPPSRTGPSGPARPPR